MCQYWRRILLVHICQVSADAQWGQNNVYGQIDIQKIFLNRFECFFLLKLIKFCINLSWQILKKIFYFLLFNNKNGKKNLLASLAHSHRALCAQFASLARMSAPRARDLMVVALRAPIYVIVVLRAPKYMNFALRAQCCALHSA